MSHLVRLYDARGINKDKKKIKPNIIKIVDKYNKKCKTLLTNWTSMEIGLVCTTYQKYSISFLKRRSDRKIPNTPNGISERIINRIRTKTDPL